MGRKRLYSIPLKRARILLKPDLLPVQYDINQTVNSFVFKCKLLINRVY